MADLQQWKAEWWRSRLTPVNALHPEVDDGEKTTSAMALGTFWRIHQHFAAIDKGGARHQQQHQHRDRRQHHRADNFSERPHQKLSANWNRNRKYHSGRGM